MSLIGALNIANSGLATASASLQVTSNNISNAGNADYSREVAGITANSDQRLSGNVFVGTGVDLTSVQRQVDDALQGRLNNANSDSQSASTASSWSSQIESTFNALNSTSLDTTLGTLFSSFSSLANNPSSTTLRQTVEQNGAAVAQQFNSLDGSLSQLQSNIGSQMSSLVTNANQLAQQIASLNQQISVSGGGQAGGDNSLSDQRDAAVKQLSSLVNVQSVQQGNGEVNVYVGSEPLVTGTVNRGLTQTSTSNGTSVDYGMKFTADGGEVPVTSGKIGGLVSSQTQIDSVLSQLNTLAQGVIAGVNSVHASGQGTDGFTNVTGTSQVLSASAALNATATGLTQTPVNGSFVIHVKDTSTGLSTSTLIPVNLSGAPSDTTLNSLVSSLNSVSGVQAAIVGGKLNIKSSGGTQISFSQDTSNTLASLGVNTFFQGKDAASMGVNSNIVANSNLIAAAQNGDPGDNTNALALAQVGTKAQTTLAGSSITDSYQTLIGGVTATTASAKTDATATSDVVNTLQAQRDSLSGVSIDEETINLMQQQRAYQGSARVVSTIDQMMTTLMAIL
jgi:flagellar hook-associated protein 1 FlgK